MNRLLAPALVLAALVPAAAGASPYYQATPVAAPSKPVLITSGTVWRWNTDAYAADKSTQRDAIMCEMVAHSAGKLSTFSVGGQPFDAAALTKCNARAR